MRLLIERTTRGLGDAVMLTSTIASLRKSSGADEVSLAIPENLHPVFFNNPDLDVLTTIELADRNVDEVVDCSTSCASYEADNQPFIQKNRPQVWCEAAGHVWDRSPPTIHLSDQEMEARDQTVAAWARPIIGIGFASVDRWRDYPHMPLLIAKLRRELGGTVVIFHDKRPILWKHEDLKFSCGLPIRGYFTAAAACDMMVSPDTAHIHVAAALGVPVYIIDGPTDGRLRMDGYRVDFERPPRYTHCGRQPSWYDHCEPCWCLFSLRPKVVVEGVRRLWKRTRYGVSPQAGMAH